MEKRILLWITALLLTVSTVMAQDVPVGVVVAFKKGSSTELSKFLGDKVELVIQNRSSSVDRDAAAKALDNFFTTNKVTGFTVNHQGKRDDSSFIVGTLTTSEGNYRVNCFFKRIQNKYLIHQIRIDKTNE